MPLLGAITTVIDERRKEASACTIQLRVSSVGDIYRSFAKDVRQYRNSEIEARYTGRTMTEKQGPGTWKNRREAMGRTSLLRVMLADDFLPWRRYLISRLQDEPDLEIVCVAADGFEAIQKANELQPDLILIGIGLPNKHGIEAIRQIRTLAPKTKILMLSQDSDPAAARDALSAGAHGYVFKADSPLELMSAVRAVILGKQFVSGRFVGVEITDPLDS